MGELRIEKPNAQVYERVYGWRADKYRSAMKQIARWEKRYQNKDNVIFLVRDRLADVRSPGQREAYQQWINDNVQQ